MAQLAMDLDAVNNAGAVRDPRFNIAPTTTIAVLAEVDGQRTLEAMRWGLVPSWTKDVAKLPALFNARVETAAEKPSFRAAVKRRHAAVPMDGWYEWVAQPDGKGRKQPFFMSAPGDEGLLMAGLWEQWSDPSSETLLSATVVTTAAVGPLREVHERMPLVVRPDVGEAWLSGQIADPRDLVDRAALETWAAGLEIRPVSTAVSNVRNDGPELLAPVEAPPWWNK